jgi:hypothetical protein
MRSPAGTVEGLCAASATIFAVGIAFLGYWGFLEPTPWRSVDIMVVIAALGGFGALGLVPWIATAPSADDGEARLTLARRAVLVGVAGIWLAVAFSLLVPHAK